MDHKKMQTGKLTMLLLFLCLFCNSCASFRGVVKIPEAGEIPDKDILVYDQTGRPMLDLSPKHKIFRYKNFIIKNPLDERFVAYVDKNSYAVAEWGSNKVPAGCSFSATAIHFRLGIQVNHIEGLKQVYGKAVLSDPMTIRYDGKIEERDGLKVLAFNIRTREKSGEVQTRRGYIALDPADEESAIEVCYTCFGYEDKVYDQKMIELGEKFLDSVRITSKPQKKKKEEK